MSTAPPSQAALEFTSDFSFSDEPDSSLLGIDNDGRVNRSLATQEQLGGRSGYSAYVRHVQYGTYDGARRPACLIVLDLAFRFPPRAGARFSSAEVEATFERALDQSRPSVRSTDPSLDPVVANFAPKRVLGEVREQESTRSFGIEIPALFEVPFGSAGVTASWSVETAGAEEGRAELYGNLAQDDDHDDGANSVTWDLTENPVSKEGIMRSFRAAVILSCRPQEAFWMRVSVKPVVKFSLDPRRLFTKRLLQSRDDPVFLDGITTLGSPAILQYTEFTDPEFPWKSLLQVPGALGES